MRYGQRVQDPGRQRTASGMPNDAWSAAAPDDPSPVIEELGATSLGPVGRPFDRRLGLVVGMAAAIVGFGFMGHDRAPVTGRGGDVSVAPVSIATPAAQALEDAMDVPNHARGGAVVPAVEAAIVVGVVMDAGATWLTIDGTAMTSVIAFDVEARNASDALLATGSATVVGDDERPASAGGPRSGSGSVHTRIKLPAYPTAEALGVTITWRDAPDGSTRSVSERLARPDGAP
jgi:hypothetical protein